MTLPSEPRVEQMQNHQWCLDTVAIDIATVGIDFGRQQHGSPGQHGVTLPAISRISTLDGWSLPATTEHF